VAILAWLNLGVCALLGVACVGLYLDARGARKALGSVVASLQRQTAAHNAAIGNLSRALALLAPPDARPTAPHGPVAVGLSRPFKPSPEQVTEAREAYRAKELPPVDMEGDRGGINPGDPIPSESTAEIRARFEQEAEARSQARGAPPSSTDEDEPEDERTRVYSKQRVRGATLLGGLAGAPLERPVSSPTRTAEAFRKAHPSLPTLLSEGAEPPPATRDTLTPTAPGVPGLDAAVERAWHSKIEASRGAGKDTRHCHGARCMRRGSGTDLCDCKCDGCSRLLDLLVDAVRDVTGRE
jgi:hypothetical protein